VIQLSHETRGRSLAEASQEKMDTSVEGVGLQPLVVIVWAIGMGVVDEVGRRADLVVDANVAGLLDGGRGYLVWLENTFREIKAYPQNVGRGLSFQTCALGKISGAGLMRTENGWLYRIQMMARATASYLSIVPGSPSLYRWIHMRHSERLLSRKKYKEREHVLSNKGKNQ
jgi:hypothetical protein